VIAGPSPLMAHEGGRGQGGGSEKDGDDEGGEGWEGGGDGKQVPLAGTGKADK